MNADAGQIWFLEEPRLGTANHGHYVLIVYPPTQGKVCINFIATGRTCPEDLEIRPEDAGFESIGLKHASHLLRNEVRDIRTAILQAGKYKGKISGKLKQKIEDWWGAPI